MCTFYLYNELYDILRSNIYLFTTFNKFNNSPLFKK